MAIDATFWVAVSFVIFFGALIYLKIPQKVSQILDKMISDIKNEINESEKLRTEAKNLLDNAQKKLDTAQTVSNDILKKAIDKSGICFLHAPLFHPAMKNVAPIRKELGMKTFFNMLGPLVNPSMPKKQIVGVFNLELARIYNYLLQKTDKKYSIIYSLDGYDEISLTNDTKIYSNNSEKNYSSKEFGLENIKPDEIKGGVDIPSSSKIFMNVLNGIGTESQNNVVCANAGVAISISKGISISEGFEAAKESLKSSKALSSFNKLKEIMK